MNETSLTSQSLSTPCHLFKFVIGNCVGLFIDNEKRT